MPGKKFGIRFRTTRSTDQIEDWLDKNCTARWNITLAGMLEDSAGNFIKQLIVYFDANRDREKFSRHFFAH
ncbi:MAG: hypothetical protein V3R66_00480 [Rhodospirillales bacterium]